MSGPLVLTGSLGGSKLSRAARAGELSRWYREIPRGAAEWHAYGRTVADSVSPRWFEELHDAIAPTGRAADRLRRSADGNGLVVTTGQQPGLFGGPLMALVKAISARSVADVLQETLGVPVAPVFWAATDDADFDEASVVAVALDGGARELHLQRRAPAGTPMARVPIGDDVADLAEQLREACGSAPHASYLADAVRAYQPGSTLGDAYVTLLRQILEPLEIAVLDASHACVWHAARPVLHRAVSKADLLTAALQRRGEEIAGRGFSPQVDEVKGLSLVFLNSAATKSRLSLSAAASLGPLDDHQFLSSTVLLRPVVERAILPTAAYVAGPGEIAYFAQVSAVAETLEVAAPLVLPRWSAAIIEPRVQRILDELGIAREDVPLKTLEGRLARERLSPKADRALRALRSGVAKDVDALQSANDGIVPPAVVEGLRRALEHRLTRVERRFVAGVKRRETELMRKVDTARGALFPYDVPQERKLAYVPFLARYGPSLIGALVDAAHLHARETVMGVPSPSPRSASTSAGV